MKKNIIISLAFIILILLPPRVLALTPTPIKSGPTTSPVPSTTSVEKDKTLIDQINNLKEKVASKVAELKLVEKRGIVGVVATVDGNKITLTDIQSNTRYVDVDELTKFTSSAAKGSFGISDITKGMNISVVGLYNKQSKRILARFIEVYTLPSYLSGTISDVDKVNYTITVASENSVSTIVDIENVTKTFSYTDSEDLTRLGFSKMKKNDRVYVVGYPAKNSKNRIVATRVTVFPELPANQKIIIPQASSDSFEKTTATPSSKVTPNR